MEPRQLTKTRKLWNNSGSIVVSLPSEICDLFGWKGGDEVRFLVNQDGRQLIIEKASNGSNGPASASEDETTESKAGKAA